MRENSVHITVQHDTLESEMLWRIEYIGLQWLVYYTDVLARTLIPTVAHGAELRLRLRDMLIHSQLSTTMIGNRGIYSVIHAQNLLGWPPPVVCEYMYSARVSYKYVSISSIASVNLV